MTDDVAAPVDALREAAETMRAVRDRCVWTQQIDHRALVPYLVEESAELIDAVEEGSRTELREELGDLLWQVLFHAEIARRDPDDPFDIDDVARGLTDKMVRRHPHVFGDAVATTPEEVLVHWNAAKAAEKSARTSVLDGVSERMPSLALAQKLVGKAAQVGVGVMPDQVTPAEDGDAGRPLAGNPLSDGRAPRSETELGDALLALVAAARAAGWDAERALRERLRGLQGEIREVEARGPRGELT
jgi:XTP/dITP diphosphohydrolase